MKSLNWILDMADHDWRARVLLLIFALPLYAVGGLLRLLDLLIMEQRQEES